MPALSRRLLLAALCLSITHSAVAQSPEITVLSGPVQIEAPRGHLILEAPRKDARVVKRVEEPGKVTVAALTNAPDGRYYVSDWSWERYQNQRIAPNWILILGPEVGSSPPATPAPTNSVTVALTELGNVAVTLFPETKTLTAPGGITVGDGPLGKRLSTSSVATEVRVVGYLDFEQTRYYVSDWSWERYLSKRIPPNFLTLNGNDGLPPQQPSMKMTPLPEKDAWESGKEYVSQAGTVIFPKGHVVQKTPSKEAPIIETIETLSDIRIDGFIDVESGPGGSVRRWYKYYGGWASALDEPPAWDEAGARYYSQPRKIEFPEGCAVLLGPDKRAAIFCKNHGSALEVTGEVTVGTETFYLSESAPFASRKTRTPALVAPQAQTAARLEALAGPLLRERTPPAHLWMVDQLLAGLREWGSSYVHALDCLFADVDPALAGIGQLEAFMSLAAQYDDLRKSILSSGSVEKSRRRLNEAEAICKVLERRMEISHAWTAEAERLTASDKDNYALEYLAESIPLHVDLRNPLLFPAYRSVASAMLTEHENPFDLDSVARGAEFNSGQFLSLDLAPAAAIARLSEAEQTALLDSMLPSYHAAFEIMRETGAFPRTFDAPSTTEAATPGDLLQAGLRAIGDGSDASPESFLQQLEKLGNETSGPSRLQALHARHTLLAALAEKDEASRQALPASLIQLGSQARDWPADGAPSLRAGEALLAFLRVTGQQGFEGESENSSRYWAAIFRSDRDPVVLPVATAPLLDLYVELLLRNYTNRQSLAQAELIAPWLEGFFKEIYSRTFARFAPHLKGVKTLYWTGDGYMNFIPLDLMLTLNGQADYPQPPSLIEIHSAQALERTAPAMDAAFWSRGIVLVGDPDFDSQSSQPGVRNQIGLDAETARSLSKRAVAFGQLDGTREEIQTLAKMIAERHGQAPLVLSGGTASESRVRESIGQARVLHLATHGFFFERADGKYEIIGSQLSGELASRLDSPLFRSGITLSGANRTFAEWSQGRIPPTAEDGLLLAEEIKSLDLSGIGLLSLSACSTADGESISGGAVQGLRSALLDAGVGTAVLTLWPIDDAFTVEYMEDFYRHCLSGLSPGEAMSRTRRHHFEARRARHGLADAVFNVGPFLSVSSAVHRPD